MDCSRLDPESHDVLWHLQEEVGLRRKPNPQRGTRIYRTTVQRIHKALKIEYNDIPELLRDLETHGFVRFFEDNKSMGEGELGCTCSGRRASVARRTTTDLTRSASSGEEDGEWEDAKGPKVQGFAPNAREAELCQETLKERNQRRQREKLEQHEERIRQAFAKRPEDLNSHDLALIFRHLLVQHQLWASAPPGSVNHKALASNFAQWIREGTDPAFIREMIEVFVKDRRMLADGDVAWKVFVNRRALLARRAHNRVRSQAPDDLGWNDPYDDGDDDDDLGWGESQAITNPEH